jgi:2-keto-4-pentenoate hydratase/2-oxohepta-3-ene-1,7-dioic acid hydratase in catechol pathway
MDQHSFPRRQLWGFAVVAYGLLVASPTVGAAPPAKYCRFQAGDQIAYGLVEGDRVRQLAGDLFGEWTRTDKTYALADVRLLVPTRPTQVLAMAGNYRSHLGGDVTTTTITTVTTVKSDAASKKTSATSETTAETRAPGEVPPKYAIPQPFFKSPSCLTAHGTNILIPPDATTVHYEGELVIVIGRRAQKVSRQDAPQYVLGVTCGIDVSERVWQKNDIQWWRAKSSDTFGPCGPYITTGIDYNNLLLQTRVNGEVKQKERTSEFIHDVATVVSAISQQVTLEPGDLIFTGTPGETSALKPGDVVEVEIEGIGVLQNKVAAGK